MMTSEERNKQMIVHHRDAKSGRTVNETPYVLVCDRDLGNHYVRDGKRFSLDWSPMESVEAKAEEPKHALDPKKAPKAIVIKKDEE